MSNKNKTNFKKTLVRNTQVPLTNCRITKNVDTQTKVKNVDKTVNCDLKKNEDNVRKIDHPEPYSLLNFNKQLDEIAKLKSKKDSKLAVDEKITRKVNFPSDQPIYKDLIPLATSPIKQPTITSRGPMPLKDTEPVLTDFLTERTITDYPILPQVALKKKGMVISCNNLRLYHIIMKK